MNSKLAIRNNMKNVQEAAKTATVITMTKRNEAVAKEWLGSVGIEAPLLPVRCLHPEMRTKSSINS